MLTKPGCPHCTRAKELLRKRGLGFQEVVANPAMLRAVPGRRTTPQIFFDGQHLGGADELAEKLG